MNDHDEYVLSRQMAQDGAVIEVAECPRCGDPIDVGDDELPQRHCYACTIEENL